MKMKAVVSPEPWKPFEIQKRGQNWVVAGSQF
jgi:hypothetical protein